MRIPSGVVDQYCYFVAVDATDFATRETGLTTFTVYRSRNGGAAAAMTTPTINETDSVNMPGVYELLLDEDMTIDAGDDSQEMVFHITHAGMAPVTRTIELYRPKITAGYTLGVESDGDLTKVNTLDGHTAQTGDSFARLGAPAGASVSADVAAVKADAVSIANDTTMIPTVDAKIDVIDGIVDAILVDTAVIGAAGAGLTAVPWNASWDAQVESEVTDALNAYDPPTKAELDSAVAPLATAANLATVAGYLDTEIAAILEDTGTTLPASIAALDLLIDAIKLVTDALPNSGALTDLATAAALATVDGNVDAILVDTDTTIPGLIAALNDLAASEILTTALVESYAADGAAPTLSQAIFLIQQFLYERATVGTTVTVNRLDGSTPAATLTLDNGTSPTSITRAT